MRLFWLTLRLIRGAGARDVAKLGLMLAGVALATCALWLGAVQPRLVAYQEGKDNAPVVGGTGVIWSDAVLDGKPWAMTSFTGRPTLTTLPPGMAAWPGPGESIVSPALARALRQHPGAAAGMGRILPTQLGEAGLDDPGELVSYTTIPTTAAGARPAHVRLSPISGHAPLGSSVRTLALESAVMVGLPALLFGSVCLRVTAGSRRARTRALNLAGLSPHRGARLFGLEMAVVAAVGAALGTRAYEWVQGPLGTSGLLGGSWWPDQVHAGGQAAVVVALITGCLVYSGAYRAMRRHLTQPLSRRVRPLRRLPAVLSGCVLVLALVVLGVRCVVGALHPTGNDTEGLRTALIFGAILVAAAAVLVCVAKLIETTGIWVTRVRQPAVRLGARSMVFRSRQTARLVVGVTAVIVLGGLAASFASILGQTAISDPQQWTVAFPLTKIAPAQRSLLSGLTTLPSAVITGTGRARVVVADCPGTVAAYRQRDHDGTATVPCSGTVQRVASAGTVRTQVPAQESLPLLDGRSHNVVVPGGSSLSHAEWFLKVPATIDSPWVQQLRSGTVTVFCDLGDPRYLDLIGQLRARFPTMPINAGIGGVGGSYTEFVQQRVIVHTGTYAGVLLVLGAFALAVLDLRWESERSLSTLRAVGTSSRVLRISATVQYTLPVLIGGGLAAAVGVVGGWSYLSLGSTATMFAADIPITCVGAWLLAVVIAAITGYATGGAKFRRDIMADT